jgi:hypothetical protein
MKSRVSTVRNVDRTISCHTAGTGCGISGKRGKDDLRFHPKANVEYMQSGPQRKLTI